MNIRYKNLNQAFVEELADCYHNGTEVKSRGFVQKEKLFASFVIQDPTDLRIEVPARRFNEDYAILEWLWYLTSNSNVGTIGKFADIWNKIADDNDIVESNYGKYLKPHWHDLVDELLKDKDTRRATCVINQPYHRFKNPKDYPCTHYIHFFIRKDALHMGVYMRSNDAVFGFCNDVFTFALFQQLMLNELNSRGSNLVLGDYYHSAGSFHVYDRHYTMMEKISENYFKKAQKNGYPTNLKKVILDPDLTWLKMENFISFLDENLDKDQISSKIKEIKEIIFQ
jgi:thymidylate synthase